MTREQAIAEYDALSAVADAAESRMRIACRAVDMLWLRAEGAHLAKYPRDYVGAAIHAMKRAYPR